MKRTLLPLIASFGIAAPACSLNVAAVDQSASAMTSTTSAESMSVSDLPNMDSVTVHGGPDGTAAATFSYTQWVSGGGSAPTADAAVTFAESGTTLTPTVSADSVLQDDSTAHYMFTVLMPATMPLTLDTGSSDVLVDGMSSPVDVTAGSGNVTVTTTGALHIMASSGNVEAHGSVLAIEALSGNVDTTGSGGMVGASSGNVTVHWDGTQSLSVIASSGNVNVLVARGAAFIVQASVDSGNIDASVLDGSGDGDHAVSGTVGSATGTTLLVHASSGNVAVTFAD